MNFVYPRPGQIRKGWIVYGVDGEGAGRFVDLAGVYPFNEKAQAQKLLQESCYRSMDECEYIGVEGGGVLLVGLHGNNVRAVVQLGPVDKEALIREKALAKLSPKEREVLGL